MMTEPLQGESRAEGRKGQAVAAVLGTVVEAL